MKRLWYLAEISAVEPRPNGRVFAMILADLFLVPAYFLVIKHLKKLMT